MNNKEIYYFAFGSCMNNEDINNTVNNAERVGLAVLKDYELLFNIWSTGRNGGVANVIPEKGQNVYGSLWRIDEHDLLMLDKREHHPHIYERSIVQVESEQLQNITAVTYISKRFNKLGREHYSPTDHYVELLREGLLEASNHDPSRTLVEEKQIEEYLQRIEDIQSLKNEELYDTV